MGKHYEGRRNPDGGCIVEVVENDRRRPLPLRLDLFNHSPTGFEWGYQGSGPAQLALALLADVLDVPPHRRGWLDEGSPGQRAVKLHQLFKRAIVTYLPHDQWLLNESDVREFVDRENHQ
jgi:hypothetical protein